MAFLINSAGEPLSPKSVERRRRLAEAMMSEGMNAAPIQSWTQGAARLANALIGGLQYRRADEEEERNQKSAREKLVSALGYDMPGSIGSNQRASTGILSEVPATGPAAPTYSPAAVTSAAPHGASNASAPGTPMQLGGAGAQSSTYAPAPRQTGTSNRAALYAALSDPWLSAGDRETVMFELRRQQDEQRRTEDQARWQQEFSANQGYRNRSLGIQEKQFEQGRAPPGYRATDTGYEYVPGGPADPKVLEAQRLAQAGAQAPTTTEMYDPVTGRKQRAQYNPTTRAWEPIGGVEVPVKKPLPPAIMKMENEDLGDIQNVAQINDMLAGFKSQIEAGTLQLGPVANTISAARNWIGTSTPETRNFASFQAGLEKLRNDSLRLNSGVQTEGDAVRAWNELISNINDPAVVAQRIDEITRLNNQAAEFRANMIQQRRSEYALDPLDVNDIVSRQPGAKDQGQVPQGSPQQRAADSGNAEPRRGADGSYYIPDPNRPGKYLMVQP